MQIDRSASFKIKKDYSDLLSFCLDLMIEESLVDNEVLNSLEEFLDHYLFVENRGGWFPKQDILGLLRSLFMLSNRYGKLFDSSLIKVKDVIKKKII